MAEHFLYRPEIGTTLEKMSCKAVAEGMRRDSLGHAGPPAGAFDHPPGTDSREWLAARVEQDSALALPPVQCRPLGMQIHRHCANYRTADGNQALLSTLPEDPDQIFCEQQIGQPQATQLGDPESRSVRELQQRPIAPR